GLQLLLGVEPLERRRGLLGRQLPALDALVEVLADVAQGPLERRSGHVVEQCAEASRGGRVGDAAAHQPGADDGYGLDRHGPRSYNNVGAETAHLTAGSAQRNLETHAVARIRPPSSGLRQLNVRMYWSAVQ